MKDCWNLANLDRDHEIPRRSSAPKHADRWKHVPCDQTSNGAGQKKFSSNPRNTKKPRSTTSDSSTSLCCGVPVEHEKEDAEVKINDSDNHEMQEQTVEKRTFVFKPKEKEALKSR